MSGPWCWRWRRARLARHLPLQTASSASGDLLEEFHARLVRVGRLRAEGWLIAEVSSLRRAYRNEGRDGLTMRMLFSGLVGNGMRDTRQVVKALLHRPWYTSSILIVTALGFALLTSVFAIVDGVLFKPLSYPAERQLYAMDLSSSHSRFLPRVSADDVDAWSKAAPHVTFTGFSVQPVEWNQDVNPLLIGRAIVQPNFFDVIGVRPAVGGFAAEDFDVSAATEPAPLPRSTLLGSSTAPPASVVSPPAPQVEPRIVTDVLFRSQLGGDLSTIGRTVVTDPSTGSGYRIVGVMPRGFIFPSDLWTVGYLAPYKAGRDTLTEFIARIPPGVAASDVRFRVLAAAAATGRTRARTSPTVDRVGLQRLDGALGAASRSLFTALLAGAALLVLVAALNASSLMAARSFDRWPEWVMRRALGATALDIFRLLLAEAMLLIGTGAAIGLALAAPLLRFTRHLLPEDLALLRPAAIDWRVAAFAAAAAAVLAGLSTIGPLRRSAAGNTLAAGRNATGRARATGRRLVVTVQIAGALVLTVGGALLVGSLLTVYAHTPAITSSGVIAIQANFLSGPGSESNTGWAQARATRVKLVLKRLRNLLGVESVAVTETDLLSGGIPGSGQAQFAYPATARNTRLTIDAEAVTSDYYRVIQPHLVAGRLPTDAELAHDDPVIVVSEGVAANDWPNAPAVGQALTRSWGTSAVGPTFTVIGVVKDVHWFSWDQDAVSLYGPYALLVTRNESPTFLIRTSADQARVTADALRVIRDTDPRLRPQHAAMLDDLFVDSVRPRRFQAWLFGSFAAASLLVVGIGILGQLAMSTVQRTREVGIRMACGATRERIVATLVREQLMPVIAGLAAGGIGAAWAVRYLRSYLYELTAFDSRIWGVAIGLILVTAAIGTLIPALRASRIDPTQALRAE